MTFKENPAAKINGKRPRWFKHAFQAINFGVGNAFSAFSPLMRSSENQFKDQLAEMIGDLFRNGNRVTEELISKGVLTEERREKPLTLTEKAVVLQGRKMNSKMDEALLKTVLKELEEHDENTYEKFGLKFELHRGIWVQDTVKIIGELVATSGTVIMGNQILDNVIIPDRMLTVGNAYDKRYHAPYITLKGRIY